MAVHFFKISRRGSAAASNLSTSVFFSSQLNRPGLHRIISLWWPESQLFRDLDCICKIPSPCHILQSNPVKFTAPPTLKGRGNVMESGPWDRVQGHLRVLPTSIWNIIQNSKINSFWRFLVVVSIFVLLLLLFVLLWYSLKYLRNYSPYFNNL